MKKFMLLSTALLLVLVPLLMVVGCGGNAPASTESESSISTSSTPESQEVIRWRMQSHIPSGSEDWVRMAQWENGFVEQVKAATNGQLVIEPFGGGQILPATEQFEAVSQGTLEIGLGCSSYWVGKVPAGNFTYGVPFVLKGWEAVQGYLTQPVGDSPLDILEEEYNKYGVHIASSKGWLDTVLFSKKPVRNLEDFDGFKFRAAGLSGTVLEKVGAASVYVAAPEIYSSLEKGVVDAAFWGNPFVASTIHLEEVTDYVLYPPLTSMPTLELIVNQDALAELPNGYGTIIEMAAESWLSHHHEWTGHMGTVTLNEMLESGAIKEVCTLSEEDELVLKKYAMEVLAEEAKKDAASTKMYEKLVDFLKSRGEYPE